nr:unnamed protein product [Spirometra erinaceieuropaei]
MNKHRGRESNIYTVERLIKRRVRMSKVEYLVKWKNWPEKHNTWEPDENILDRELIKSFYDEEERKKETQNLAETKTIPSANGNATPLAKNQTPTKTPTTSVPSSPPTKATTDMGERVQKPLSVSVTPSPGSPVRAPADSRQASLHNPEAPTSGSSAATAGSSTSPPVSSLGYDTAISPDGDWHSENRLRKTTLLVATASQSSARQSNRSAAEHARSGIPMPSKASQFEAASNAVTVSAAPTTHSTTRSAVTTVTAESTERPKIRLTIPRERLIVCQTASVNSSQDSSGLLQDLEDEEEAGGDPNFRAPLELPRRSTTDVDEDGCLSIPPPSLLPAPEICESSESSLPKVVLSTKRVVSSTWLGKEKLLLKKESRHPKKKRRRESGGSSSRDFSSQRRHQSGSSASSCVSFSSTSPSVSPALPTNESPPRIAPLRIQLSRSNTIVQYPGPNEPADERPLYRVAASTHLHHHCPPPPPPLSVPYRPHLEREISITDVTVGDLTIAIKECPTPSNFFGIPSCQLVQPSRPPLAPRRPGVKSVHHPNRQDTSPMEVADENREPSRAITGAELSVIVEEEDRNDVSADPALPPDPPPAVSSPAAKTMVTVPDGETAAVPPSPPRRASTPIQLPLIDLSSSSTSSSSSTAIVTTTTPAPLEASQEERKGVADAATDAAAVPTPNVAQSPRVVKVARLGNFWAGMGKRSRRRVPLLPRTNTRPVVALSSGLPKSPSASIAENVYTFRGDSPPPLAQTVKTPAIPCPSPPPPTSSQGKEDEAVKRPTPAPPPLSQVDGFPAPGLYNAAQHQRLPPVPVLSPGGITLCQLVAATTAAAAVGSGWFPETPPPALTPFPPASLSMGGDRPSPYPFYPFLAQMRPSGAPVTGAGLFSPPPPTASSAAAICPLSSPGTEPEDMPIDLSAKR